MPDWYNLTATIIAALIGGAVAGYFSLRSITKAHEKELLRQKDHNDFLRKSVLQSLHDEIETLWDIYRDGSGAQLEALQDGQPFLSYMFAGQDYFTVYRANSHLIGTLDDADLRKAIVASYTRAKSLLDTFTLNNALLQEYERWVLLHQETQNPVHQQTANTYLQALIRHTANLKRSHDVLKGNVMDLLRRLRKAGVLATRS